MMYRLIVFFWLIFYANMVTAQQTRVDSVIYLNKSFATNKMDSFSYRKTDELLNGISLNNKGSDSSRFKLLESVISKKYLRSQPDSANILANIMFEEASEKGMKEYQAKAKQLIGQVYDVKSRFEDALIAYHQAEEYFEQAGDEGGKFLVLSKIGKIYSKMNDYTRAFEYSQRSLKYHEECQDTLNMGWDYLEIGQIYAHKSDLNRAMEYAEQALTIFEQLDHQEGIGRSLNYLGLFQFNLGNYYQAIDYYQKSLTIHRAISSKQFTSYNLNNLGRVYQNLGNYDMALKLFYEALALKREIGDMWATSETLLRIGQTQQLMNKSDVAIVYCGRCLELTSLIREKQWRSETYKCLYQANKDLGRYGEAIKYNELYLNLADTIARDDANKKLQQMELDKSALQSKIEQEKRDAQSQQELQVEKLIRNFFILGFAVMLVVAFLFFKQHNKIRNAFGELKSTQAQLFQAEKMASLGELTAGIAHEIQNPLNFVNNFSEVSIELIEEMQDELSKGGVKEVKAISIDIRNNLEKINHHGKRADAIVKGMLQHSRTSSGEKLPTDINALCDEYLRLSYHGLRAKDKAFNAAFETNFETDLPKVNVVPQDIGRVLLNLFNNAFYAVKTQDLASPPEPDYKPTVTVSTKNMGDRIEISIKDNGNGIPERIKDKIFQPFFTTKPTGQGTGLGLSLSYDIVRVHGGELKVVAKEGEGSEFIISLPIV